MKIPAHQTKIGAALNLKLAAERLGAYLSENHSKIVTAESCTGGWLGECITEIAGSSAWFDRGFITYSNESKVDMLAVHSETIKKYGAVSAEVARQMTQGALQNSLADYAIAITGVAGPTGGSPEKPVGTVYIAWQKRTQPAQVTLENYSGNRQEIRRQAVYTALNLIPLPHK
ncbi:MAG: damage-inducible protein CinA [Gammaproteobacteria bacterium]|nr:MAG: damage-inducible protein CinA [Gammaproteobacteria bacterium]